MALHREQTSAATEGIHSVLALTYPTAVDRDAHTSPTGQGWDVATAADLPVGIVCQVTADDSFWILAENVAGVLTWAPTAAPLASSSGEALAASGATGTSEQAARADHVHPRDDYTDGAVLDGDQIDVTYTPSNYTPTLVAQAADVDDLAAHLKGLDDAVGLRVGGSTGGSDGRLLVASGTGGKTLAASSLTVADISGATSGLAAHLADTANPHATDIGNLGSGTLAELNAALSDATLSDSASFEAHLLDTANPHGTSVASLAIGGTLADLNAALGGANIPEIGSALPSAISSTASAGVSSQAARQDHVHPDTGLATDADLTALSDAWDADLAEHAEDTDNPHSTDIGNLGPGTLAQLNASVIDATLASQADVSALESYLENELENHLTSPDPHPLWDIESVILGTTIDFSPDNGPPDSSINTFLQFLDERAGLQSLFDGPAQGFGAVGDGGVDPQGSRADHVHPRDDYADGAVLDGDQIDVTYTPSNYTPTLVAQAADVDDLAAHLKGIDDALVAAVSGLGGSTGANDGRLLVSSGTGGSTVAPSTVSEAALVDHLSDTDNPHGTGISKLSSGTLAQLNGAITDATLGSLATANPSDLQASAFVGVSAQVARSDHRHSYAGLATSLELSAHEADTANPHATDIGNLGSGTLAELNAAVTDATLGGLSSATPEEGSLAGAAGSSSQAAKADHAHPTVRKRMLRVQIPASAGTNVVRRLPVPFKGRTTKIQLVSDVSTIQSVTDPIEFLAWAGSSVGPSMLDPDPAEYAVIGFNRVEPVLTGTAADLESLDDSSITFRVDFPADAVFSSAAAYVEVLVHYEERA